MSREVNCLTEKKEEEKIKAALELFHSSLIIIFDFVVFIFLLFIYLSFIVFLSLFFLVWISLDIIFFFFLPYQPSFGSGCSKILSVLFLPQCRLLFRLPAICSTVSHISPGFFASLPLDGPGSSLVLGWYTKHKKLAKGGFLGGWKP